MHKYPVQFDSAFLPRVQFGFRMKIAVIGQSLFGQEVYNELRKEGHTIVGVFTIPDKDGKADPLGETNSSLFLFSWCVQELSSCVFVPVTCMHLF